MASQARASPRRRNLLDRRRTEFKASAMKQKIESPNTSAKRTTLNYGLGYGEIGDSNRTFRPIEKAEKHAEAAWIFW